MATNATTISSRGSSSRRALLLAIVFAAISALLVYSFLSRSNTGTATVASTPILVAGQDIPLGVELTDQNVILKSIPNTAKHQLAFTDKTKALGQVTTEPLTAQQQILSTQITADRAQVGLTSQIPAGKRAFSIAVSEVSADGGFVKAGDHVDVIGTFGLTTPVAPGEALVSGGKGGSGRTVALFILQNVTVLAIGQTAVQPQQSTAPASGKGVVVSGDASAARSVTLALTPDEAQKIFIAEETGTLRLALRPIGDKDPVTIAPQDNNLQKLPAQPSQ